MRHIQNISFDFDNCLQHIYVQLMAERCIAWGDNVFVCTSRRDGVYQNNIKIGEIDNKDLFEIIDELGIKRENIIFTNQQSKTLFLIDHKINIHFDDDDIEIDYINRSNVETLKGILINYKIYY